MRTSLKNVVAWLEERAEREWQKLMELEYEGDANEQSVGEQRARWAAYDTALEVAKGKGTTSFETEQRSA